MNIAQEAVPLGANLTLAGISEPAKKLIRERGSLWRIIGERDTVEFSGQRGPWIMVTPAGEATDISVVRYVHALKDPDFRIVLGAPKRVKKFLELADDQIHEVERALVLRVAECEKQLSRAKSPDSKQQWSEQLHCARRTLASVEALAN